jgi:predicted CopG family antitoxin
VHKTTVEKLDKLKKHDRETYEDVILRLVELADMQEIEKLKQNAMRRMEVV